MDPVILELTLSWKETHTESQCVKYSENLEEKSSRVRVKEGSRKVSAWRDGLSAEEQRFAGREEEQEPSLEWGLPWPWPVGLGNHFPCVHGPGLGARNQQKH